MTRVSPKPLTRTEIQEWIPKMPFNHHLGVRVSAVHRDGLTVECPLRPELMNGMGVLHGGVTSTLADIAVGMGIIAVTGGKRRATTVELKINYLRPVSDGKVVRARSRIRRIGNTTAVGTVDLFDAQRNLVGLALVTYMLLP